MVKCAGQHVGAVLGCTAAAATRGLTLLFCNNELDVNTCVPLYVSNDLFDLLNVSYMYIGSVS